MKVVTMLSKSNSLLCLACLIFYYGTGNAVAQTATMSFEQAESCLRISYEIDTFGNELKDSVRGIQKEGQEDGFSLETSLASPRQRADWNSTNSGIWTLSGGTENSNRIFRFAESIWFILPNEIFDEFLDTVKQGFVGNTGASKTRQDQLKEVFALHRDAVYLVGYSLMGETIRSDVLDGTEPDLIVSLAIKAPEAFWTIAQNLRDICRMNYQGE